ncbi:MAG: acyltransferase family protein [Pseudomonadota bacterium]
MSSITTNHTARLLAIDRLRTAMMLVVMFGHAMLPYVTSPRRFNDPASSVWFDWVGIGLYAFAMPVFFVTAGFAGAALLQRRGTRAFWQHRWLRLGVPLLVGYAVLTPLTRAAYEFAVVTSTEASIAAGWQYVRELHWLRWSKLYHLWFLASLILFSAIAFFADRVLQRISSRWPFALDSVLGSRLTQASGCIWLGLAAGTPMALSYIGGTGQGTDAWMQLALLGFFGLGWWLQSRRDVRVMQSQHWRFAVAGTIVLLPLSVWSTQTRLLNEQTSDLVTGLIAGFANGLLGAFATTGLLGAAQIYWRSSSRLMKYLNDISYWVYLVHYPIVIAAGGLVSVLPSTAMTKYLLSLALAIPTVLLIVETLRHLMARRRATIH